VEGEDHLGLVHSFQPQRQHDDLDDEGGNGEEIVARQRRIGRIEKMRAEQQRQNQPAEQAGPALLEAEQQEFIGERAEPAVRLDRLQPRPDRREAGCAFGLANPLPPVFSSVAVIDEL
jgi:hypothetical protein